MFLSHHLRETVKDVLRGKSAARWLTNYSLAGMAIEGMVLDLGAGRRQASHYRYLDIRASTRIHTVDLTERSDPDHVLDLEKDPIPYPDDTFTYVLCFNLIEHLYDYTNLLTEASRVLRPTGILLGSTPFLLRIHRNPHDFHRLTDEALRRALSDHGFMSIDVHPVGTGPMLAAYAQAEFAVPRLIRPFIILPTLLADAAVRLLKGHVNYAAVYPLAHLFLARKKAKLPVGSAAYSP